MVYEDRYRTPKGNKCRAICINENHEIIVSCDQYLAHYTKDMEESAIAYLTNKILSMAALPAGELLVLLNDGEVLKLEHPYADGGDGFLEICNATCIAVSNDNLCILARTDDVDEITVYNLVTKVQKSHIFENTKFVSITCHFDGDILALDQQEGTLHKYAITSDQDSVPKLMWSCNGLTGAYAVCTDQKDLIYVVANGQFIYIINDEGEAAKHINPFGYKICLLNFSLIFHHVINIVRFKKCISKYRLNLCYQLLECLSIAYLLVFL